MVHRQLLNFTNNPKHTHTSPGNTHPLHFHIQNDQNPAKTEQKTDRDGDHRKTERELLFARFSLRASAKGNIINQNNNSGLGRIFGDELT